MPEADTPSPVTVIGLGFMGSALARALLRNGHPTTVWNRSAARAADLVGKGAIHAATVAEAVEASPLVMVCVFDHAAVRDILDAAGDALSGCLLVDLTSGTPQDARETAIWAAQRTRPRCPLWRSTQQRSATSSTPAGLRASERTCRDRSKPSSTAASPTGTGPTASRA